MPSALLLWMIAIEQLIHWPINWDRVWRFEIIASTGEADKQKTTRMLPSGVDPRGNSRVILPQR